MRSIHYYAPSRSREIHMTSSPNRTALIRKAFSGDGAAHHADRLAQRGLDPRTPRPDGLPELTTPNQDNRSIVVTARKPARILLVDAALALNESHVSLLRSIPAIVVSLASYAGMYLHEEHGYALVILAPHPKSREDSEAARRRWSAARIILLESEPSMIDDWLYDERVDPNSHPATLREAAIRQMTESKYWIEA
jgi:hypothetical protein